MYEKITGENPYQQPMRIFPAVHYTMGGLWVDYNLMSNIPGLHVLGEANFSDHGANRLGASALMQGLADGYFVIPYTLGHYIAGTNLQKIDESHEAFRAHKDEAKSRLDKMLSGKGSKTVDEIHRQLGQIMWDNVGMSRTAQGLDEAIQKIRTLRSEFWNDTRIPGEANYKNSELEKAGRVADFLELGELMATDALHRKESCGGHFRDEYQTPDNEALRDDANFCYAAAWQYQQKGNQPDWLLNKEPLTFEYVKLSQRSYK
jgi:succinate dehydrogenase / fumarate reductase flavoprotein subunit